MDTAIVNINAYILTGGQSRRLTIDKSLIQLNGKTLTEIIYEKLSFLFNNIYVVGKENHFPDFNFIQDIKPIQCPLNGIVTALEHNQKEWLFIITCDLPLIKTNSINKLYENINSKAHAILPVVSDTIQPLCAFYHRIVLKDFNTAISKGDYSLMKLLDQIEIVKVIIPSEDEEQFLNINYPEDLKKAKDLINLENTKWTVFKT